MISTLPYDYQLALLIALETGFRIGDVVSLTFREAMGICPVFEQKTGKPRHCELPCYLKGGITERFYEAGCDYSAFVFPSKKKPGAHIHRTTIYRALKRAAGDLRLQVSPHTTRKIYAVELYRKTGDVEAVREALNHDNLSTTLLYCFADRLQQILD